MEATASLQTGSSGWAPAPELFPSGARAAATSPPAFVNKPYPFFQLLPDPLLLNLTHTTPCRKLYLLRCRILHNFSPAYFTLVHANPSAHLQRSAVGDTVLSDAEFFADVANAAAKFFSEVQSDATRQDAMNARLLNIDKGGAIYYE